MNLFKSINWFRLTTLVLSIMLIGPVCCDRSDPMVRISTDLGDITLVLYPKQAPVTVANFLSHIEKGDYTNSMFYRVVRLNNQPQNKVKIEVIQGGLFHDEIVDTIRPIIHETTQQSEILHTDGVISMARNEPGSASTEFFICVGDQPSLDYGGMRNPDGQGFAAFGKVIQGMDVVRNIQQLPDEGQYLKEQVRIRKISIITGS